MNQTARTEVAKPQPHVTELTREFWEGARNHRLMIQRCTNAACHKAMFYPRVCCPFCKGSELHWESASGSGSVISHTTVYRTHHDGFNNDAPYVFAAVELAEGALIYAQMPDAPTDGSSLVGRTVAVDFVEHGPDCVMPVFRLAAASLAK